MLARSRTDRQTWLLAIFVSVLVHGAVLGPRVWVWLTHTLMRRSAGGARVPSATNQPVFRSREQIQKARRELVRRALADRKAGGLRLGRFVIAADALDAEEQHARIDVRATRRRYDARCNKLRDELRRDPSVVVATQRAFSDLAYSVAVNRMSEMLRSGVGACGPTAQLMASCLYDLGRRDGLALHYWGGVNAAGVTHITATWRQDGVRFDLASSALVRKGGVEFPADQLIEAYARAHGILPPLPGGVPARPPRDEAMVASFSYPPNDDVFASGEPPLFRRRSASGRAASASFLDDAVDGASPAYLIGYGGLVVAAGRCPLRPGVLYPARVDLTTASGSSRVELVRVPTAPELSWMAGVLARYDTHAPRGTKLERLTTSACLALSYDWAATRFAVAGYYDIARESERRAHQDLQTARRLHRELQKEQGAAFPRELDQTADQWTLIAFKEGADTLLSLETGKPRTAQPDYDGRQGRMDALLLSDTTRDSLIRAAPRLGLDQRVVLLGLVATLSVKHPEIQLPQSPWLDRGLAAYQRMLEALGPNGHAFEAEEFARRQLDVLRAVGATDTEVRERQRQFAEAAKALRLWQKRSASTPALPGHPTKHSR